MHAGRELADIVASLMLTLFPDAELYRGQVGIDSGHLVSLYMVPGADGAGFERLKSYLYQLVDRPEWRERYALAREVSDRQGTYLEVIVPVAPESYSGGPAIVGPFADELAADEFGSRHATTTLSHDTYRVAGGWLADLFEVPAPGWEEGSR